MNYDELSENARKLIQSWEESRQPISRPCWDEIYLEMCFKVAKRSHDAQTRCGAVLVNPDYEIIATGYNGYIREVANDVLPNLRPLKYPFMIHAEHNAILNCARQGKSTKGATCYCTGEPCNNCLMILMQTGVKEVIYTNQNRANMTQVDSEYLALQEVLLYLARGRMQLREVDVAAEKAAEWRK